jgi:hypothetical protein
MKKFFCAVITLGLMMCAESLLPTAFGTELSSTLSGGFSIAGPSACLDPACYGGQNLCYFDLNQDKTVLSFTFTTPIAAANIQSATLSLTGTVEMFIGKHNCVVASTCSPIIGSNGFTTVLASDYRVGIMGTSTVFALDRILIFESYPGQGLPAVGDTIQVVDVTSAIKQILTASGPTATIPVELQFVSAPCNIVFFKFVTPSLDITVVSQYGPPTNKDQCMNGGWQQFNFPRTFNNQGDCIQFVNTGK